MKKFYFLLICLFTLQLFQAQTVYNLNQSEVDLSSELTLAQRSSNTFFDSAKRARTFQLNPQIGNHQNLQAGDQIVLQLFNDVTHLATVLRKYTDINGVTAITLKLNNYEYAYAYISLSPDSYLLTVDIPEENKKYSSRSGINQSQAYMFQLDETEFQNLSCGVDDEVHSQFQDEGKGISPQIPQGVSPLPGVSVDGPGNVLMNTGCNIMPDINDPATIRIMIVYTPAAENWSNINQGGILNTINTTMANLNNTSINNNLGINFQLAYSGLVSYTEQGTGTDWVNLFTDGNGILDNVHDLRKIHNSDLVAMLTFFTGDGIGGIANLLDTKYGNNRSAFSVTKVYAATDNITFTHEIGHNMGANHNLYQSTAPGPTNWENWPANTWSSGWRWQDTNGSYYGDLMTYPRGSLYPDGNYTINLPFFSDPTYLHNGNPVGNSTLADNARTIREIKHYVARYKETIDYCGAGNAPLFANTALYIDNVTMGDINNTSGGSSARYGDFTALATCMMPGDSQTLNISVANSAPNRPVKVWIDWNNDTIFDPVTELVYDSGTGAAQHSVTITAPLGVSIGDKRMRIRTFSTYTAPVVDTPCGYSGVGEVEDYTIRVESPPPCTAAAVPQNLTVNSVTSYSANLSWLLENGVDFYELRYRETLTTDWNNVSPVLYSNFTLEGLDLLTEYEVQLRAICGGTVSPYTASVIFTTDSFDYCASTSTSTTNTFIQRVQLNTIDNISADENGGYSDFTNVSTTLQQGQSYTITITHERVGGHTVSVGYGVWIDYNYDGAFDGPSEQVGVAFNSLSTHSFTFTVPYGVVPGPTRMRVSAKYGNRPTACEIFANGEVEDYTVVLGTNPPCSAATIPTNLTLKGTTPTTASLFWNGVAGASYDLRYKLVSDSNWTTVSDLEFPNAILEGLLLSQEYEAQVRSKCDGGATSAYSASLTFFVDYDYCQAVFNGGFLISRVRLANIDNTSANNTGYSNFTHIVGELQLGATYTITVNNNGGPFGRAYAAYIDYNYDGVFDVPSERVWSQSSTLDLEVSGTFTVPTGLDLNRVRLRIIMAQGGIPGPCSTSTTSGGEVEDYTIILTPPGFTFQDGSWTPGNPVGVSTTNDDIVVLNGTAVLTGDLQANNIAISEGATLNTTHTITMDGDIVNNGLLLFSSNVTSTGQLDTFTGSITGSGLVTIERHIPARRAFRLLSTPVTTTGSIHDNWQEGSANSADNPNPGFGTHITGSNVGANGFDASPTGNPSLFMFNNANQTWNAAPNTNLDGLVAGNAYRLMVRGDRSIDVNSNNATPTNTILRTTGVLHTGPYVVSGLSETASDYNFIGNPYPAAVNMDAVLAASGNLNATHYWVWDPSLGGTPTPGQAGGRGAFVAVNVGDNTSNNTSSQANKYLQPGQAAFVQTNANGLASLVFQELHKAVNQPQTQVFSVLSSIRINLYDAISFAAGSTASDGVLLKFSDEGDNAVTYEDAAKFYNLDENLASVNDQNLLSIESRALPVEDEIIPLFINQYRKTSYVFEVSLSEMNGIAVFLKDHFTGFLTELPNNETTLYAFQVDTTTPGSIAEDRFELLFDEVNMSVTDTEFGKNFILYPNPAKNTFYIATQNIVGDEVVVTVNSITGQKVVSNTMKVPANGQLQVELPGLTAGLYLVELVHKEEGAFTAKLIKNQ